MSAQTTIKVRRNGPYRVTGSFTILDADGRQYAIEGGDAVLCRCGGSQTKPFCDGSHKINGFTATESAPDAPDAGQA